MDAEPLAPRDQRGGAAEPLRDEAEVRRRQAPAHDCDAVPRRRDFFATRPRCHHVPRVRRATRRPVGQPRRRGRAHRHDHASRDHRRAIREDDARQIVVEPFHSFNPAPRDVIRDGWVLRKQVRAEVAEQRSRRQKEVPLEATTFAVGDRPRLEIDKLAFAAPRRRELLEQERVVGAGVLVARTPEVRDLQRLELVVPSVEPGAALVNNAHSFQDRFRRLLRAPLPTEIRASPAPGARFAAESDEEVAALVRVVVEQPQQQR